MSPHRLPDLVAKRKLADLESTVAVAFAKFTLSRFRGEVPAGTRAAYEFSVPEGLSFDVVMNRIANLVAWLHRPGGGFTRTMRLQAAPQRRLVRIFAEEKEPVHDELEAAIVGDDPAAVSDAEAPVQINGEVPNTKHIVDHIAGEMDKLDPGAEDLRKLRRGK